MKVTEKSKDRLVLTDNQLDKRLGVAAMSLLMLFLASQFALGGTRDDFLVALIPTGIAVGLGIYLWLTLLSSVLTLDRPSGKIVLVVSKRSGQETWEWPLDELAGAELSELRRAGEGRRDKDKRPVMVMKDETRVPMRPYHSTGGQSFSAVAAIQQFLGQEITGAPVGWIPDEE